MLVNDELNEEKKETIFDNLRKIMKANEDTIINNRLLDGRKIKENPPVSWKMKYLMWKNDLYYFKQRHSYIMAGEIKKLLTS